jgi:plastocyanin/heme-degrading monooxygenase HmoA
MEYVQQVNVHVAAAKLGDARVFFDDLEAHRRELRGLRGFVSMSIARSIEPGGDTLVSVETRWKDAPALEEYLASARNAEGIVRSHAALTVPDSLNVRRLEALEGDGEDKARIVSERFFASLAVPMVIFGFGLAIVYGLSRVYLEMGSDGATPLAIVVAGGILLIAWYFAQNRTAPAWQVGGVVAAVATLLIAGVIWAQVDDRYPPEVFGRDEPEEGEPAEPGGPGEPGEVPSDVITLDDNVFVFGGEENPTIPAPSDQEVTFQLANEGNALHNVHVSVGGYDESICEGSGDDPCSDPSEIQGGEDGTITFNLPPGSYEFRCDFHPSEMIGTFDVRPGVPPPGGPPGGVGTPAAGETPSSGATSEATGAVEATAAP